MNAAARVRSERRLTGTRVVTGQWVFHLSMKAKEVTATLRHNFLPIQLAHIKNLRDRREEKMRIEFGLSSFSAFL